MRKRTKRLLAVFMATAMLAGMTGCGTSGSALDTATSEKKTEKTDDSKTEKTSDTGSSGDTIKLGLVADYNYGRVMVEWLKEMAPDEPYITSNCAIAYNAVHIWAEAVETAGSYDTEDVINAIETKDLEFDGPGGHVKVEPKTHHLYTDMSVVEIDENHDAQVVETYEQVEPSYLLDMGIGLSKEDPQTQYSPLDESN